VEALYGFNMTNAVRRLTAADRQHLSFWQIV